MMRANKSREYARESDVEAEGQILLQPGDKLDKEIANLKEWMSDLDVKVDKLIAEGCSHRGNDLAKLSRIEAASEGVRQETGKIKDSVFQLSLSFESYKTETVKASNTTDNKINNLKLGIVVQCLILVIALLIFVAKEFVLPAVKNPLPTTGAIYDKPHVVVDPEVWNRLMKERENSRK